MTENKTAEDTGRSASFLSYLKTLIVQLESIRDEQEPGIAKLLKIIRNSNFRIDDHGMERLSVIVDLVALSETGIETGNMRFCDLQNEIRSRAEKTVGGKLDSLIRECALREFDAMGLNNMVIVGAKQGKPLFPIISGCFRTFHEPAVMLGDLNSGDRNTMAVFLGDLILLDEWIRDMDRLLFDYNVIRNYHPIVDRAKFILILKSCSNMKELLERFMPSSDPDSTSLVVDE